MKKKIVIELENGLTLQLDGRKYKIFGDAGSSELLIKHVGDRHPQGVNRITEPLNR